MIIRDTSRTIQTGSNRRLDIHDARVGFLETLANLMGCHVTIGGMLPDGSRPDVLRFDVRRGLLFVADAKNTETPGARWTQARLLKYLGWVRTHTLAGRGAAIFAMCVGTETDLVAWLNCLGMLGDEIGLVARSEGVKHFPPRVGVVWAVYGPKNATVARQKPRGPSKSSLAESPFRADQLGR
jgi:hypothetical protein